MTILMRMIKAMIVIFFVWLIVSWLEVVLFSFYDHDYQAWNLIEIFIKLFS